MSLEFSVDEIKNGDEIPRKYTCDGENLSPGIIISSAPDNAKSFCILVEDPDAPVGLFVHWVVFNIPPSIRELKPGMDRSKRRSDGIEQGKNDFGRIGYDGPCPPKGHGFHRYYFRLYALGAKISISGTASRQDILGEIEGKVIESAEIMGRYKR
ncbi:MAG: YbhB/YbcL family Raf kinase inhibitor-like protein [Thermoplasmatales archaeon]